MPDVVLVSMPFGALFSPSIGLSLLKAELAEHNIPSTIEYFSIPFAQALGQKLYSEIADGDSPAFDDLAGEWLFSRALFGPDRSADRRYINEVLLKPSGRPDGNVEPYTRHLIARIMRARAHVSPFLDRCVDVIVRHRPKVLGLTTAFQQHTASLALARRVKQALPSTVIVLGGANCEGVMGAETIRRFPFIDAAVSGEADLVFPELVRRVLAGYPIGDLPGVRTRPRLEAERASGRFESAPAVPDLDRLPFPDYTDYFEQFGATGFNRHWFPTLFLQTSRGCWWGERVQCTFCGLNGSTMTFRSKSAGRALEELARMVGRYPGCSVQTADNILDMRYFKDFLPEFRARGVRANIFLETKSNLKKEHVRLLRDAGVEEIQPGIESLSDPVLKIMRKGVTALQNIQLLKWCKELGVKPCWNFLWGFPGEPPEEYRRMARLVPLLTHLPPPDADGHMRLDRFSPMFVDAERYGLTAVTPVRPYRHIYRLPDSAVANLAYYFTFDYREPQDVDDYVQPLVDALETWRDVASRSDLFWVEIGAYVLVWDLRPGSVAPMTVVTGVEKLLYKACDAVCAARQLSQTAAAAGYRDLSTADIERLLEPLIERGLLLRDGSRYLALALSLHDYTPSAAVLREFRRIVATLGVRRKNDWILQLTDPPGHPGRRRGPRRGTSRTRIPSGWRLRTLGASQFHLDTHGRIRIQAAGPPCNRQRRH